MKQLLPFIFCLYAGSNCIAQQTDLLAPEATAAPLTALAVPSLTRANVLIADESTSLYLRTPAEQVAGTHPATADTLAATSPSYKKNNLKINLSSLALGNYSFSYERSLTPKISFVAGYRFMPEQSAGDMWISKEISKRFLDEDDELRSDLDKIQLSNNAVTGEFRFYTGKKPGARGFYVSVYGRYTTIKTNYIYDYETQNTSYQLPLQADMKGFGGGLMIGSQWLIAKRVTFDWYIIGAHYGKLKGDLAAVRDLSPLSASQKAELEQDIEDILVIGDKQYIDATVTDQGVTGKLNGPLAGIRGLGFNIGIAF